MASSYTNELAIGGCICMKCEIRDAINNEKLSEGEVKQFVGRLLTVYLDEYKGLKSDVPMIGELEDSSYRGEVKVIRNIANIHQFKTRENGIYDRRRYLRVKVRKEATLFYDRVSCSCDIIEMAYASCVILVDCGTLVVGDSVTLRVKILSKEAVINGKIFKNCGEIGNGINRANMYVITFDENTMKNVTGDIIYNYILEISRGREGL